jgi:hypothetical protein
MDQDIALPPKRRLNAHARILRRARIFARLREGWAYDEIAREEKLTPQRIRQIVTEALRQRPVDVDTDHAKLQLARLAPALKVACEAVEAGEIRAINPLLRVLDKLDRYQKSAQVLQKYDDEARQKLMDKINRVAANLMSKRDESPPESDALDAAEPPPTLATAEAADLKQILMEETEENSPGVAASP